MSDTHNPATPAEIALWIAFCIAAAVYVVAFLLVANAGYDQDITTAAGWMTFGGMIAGLTFVPAVILTGLRQLVPALRGVPRGE